MISLFEKLRDGFYRNSFIEAYETFLFCGVKEILSLALVFFFSFPQAEFLPLSRMDEFSWKLLRALQYFYVRALTHYIRFDP